MRGRVGGGGYALIYSITEIDVSLEDPKISRLSSKPTNRPEGKIGGITSVYEHATVNRLKSHFQIIEEQVRYFG